MSVTVPAERAEEARAVMLELFPHGFEEREGLDGLELAAYTDAGGEERLWQAFGGVRSVPVEEGWEERWRAFHRGVAIGPLWVGPPWERPPTGKVAVVVEPGRAFGTGSHATTRLCLELIVDLPRDSLLDVGCGSGVLAVAAAKVGFRPVAACDLDPASVAAARRNALVNRVAVEVWQADALRAPLPRTGTVVANISLAAVAPLARRLPGPRLLTSGYLACHRPAPAGFRHLRRREREGWAADLWERHGRTE